MTKTETDYARLHAANEIAFALTLIEDDDPERYRDIANVLRRAAYRYDFLHEDYVRPLGRR